MRSQRSAFPIVLMLAVGLCGCERDHVEVTVVPRPDGSVARTIRLWRSDGRTPDAVQPPPPGLVAAAKPHYGEPLPDTGKAVAFRGTFRTVPPDVAHAGETNRGGYTVWTSRLGRVGYYRERRPGALDHAVRFRKIGEAIDLLCRVAATVARQQLEGEQGVEKLATFIATELRSDLKQLAYLYLRPWPGTGADGLDKRYAGVTVFALQFLEERGYVRVQELPRLLSGDEEALWEHAVAFLARKMGRRGAPEGLRKKLAALADGDRLDAALERALGALGTTREQFDKVMEERLEDILDIDLFGSDTELCIVLRVPAGAEVVAASVKPEKGAIRWKDTLHASAVTDLLYALWATPDTAWQTARLGRVALTGEALLDYVLWECGQRAEARRAWTVALDRLDPKRDLKAQLAAIHLALPEPDAEPSPERGAEILLEALEPGDKRE